MGCDRLTGEDVYAIGMHATCIIGRDRNGCPVVFTSPADWRLGELTSDQLVLNIMFLTDYLFATMPANRDSYIWVFNLEGFGYAHCYMETIKQCIKTIQAIFVNTNHKVVCGNPNLVTRMVWNTLQPFLSDRVKQKVQFTN